MDVVHATVVCAKTLRESATAAQFIVTGAHFSAAGRLILKIPGMQRGITVVVMGTFCAGGAASAVVGG